MQFAIIQFSSTVTIHYYFSTFPTVNWEYQIDSITQLGQGTKTAEAIQTVV